jgi:hypothetical protein
MEVGRWLMEDGRWKMEDGRCKMENGKWKMLSETKSRFDREKKCIYFLLITND